MAKTIFSKLNPFSNAGCTATRCGMLKGSMQGTVHTNAQALVKVNLEPRADGSSAQLSL